MTREAQAAFALPVRLFLPEFGAAVNKNVIAMIPSDLTEAADRLIERLTTERDALSERLEKIESDLAFLNQLRDLSEKMSPDMGQKLEEAAKTEIAFLLAMW